MVGLAIPKRWILFLAAVGLISALVATSRNEWVSAAGTIPDAPASISAVAGDGEIVVSWTAPASPGQSIPSGGSVLEDIVIVDYTVTCVSSGETVTAAPDPTSSPHTFTGLTNGDAYTCSVVVNTLAGSALGPAATASAATPAAALVLLDALNLNVSSATVAVGGSTVFTAAAVDAGGTGATLTTTTWTFGSGTGTGSLSTTTGNSVVYTAVSSGSVTINVTALQTTGIEIIKTISVTNFTPAPQPTAVPPVSNPTTPQPTPPPKPTEKSEVVVISPEAAASITVEITETDADFDVVSKFDLDLPAQSVSEFFVLTVTPVNKTEAATHVALPETHTPTSIPPLKVEITDADGEPVDRLTLNAAYTVKITVSKAELDRLGLNMSSLEILKARNPLTGPFTPLATTFTILANGDVVFEGSSNSFSTFVVGTRVTAGAPAVPTAVPALPSTGDVAPTTGQAVAFLMIGLVLAVSGGAYLRRQRKVAGAR